MVNNDGLKESRMYSKQKVIKKQPTTWTLIGYWIKGEKKLLIKDIVK